MRKLPHAKSASIICVAFPRSAPGIATEHRQARTLFRRAVVDLGRREDIAVVISVTPLRHRDRCIESRIGLTFSKKCDTIDWEDSSSRRMEGGHGCDQQAASAGE